MKGAGKGRRAACARVQRRRDGARPRRLRRRRHVLDDAPHARAARSSARSRSVHPAAARGRLRPELRPACAPPVEARRHGRRHVRLRHERQSSRWPSCARPASTSSSPITTCRVGAARMSRGAQSRAGRLRVSRTRISPPSASRSSSRSRSRRELGKNDAFIWRCSTSSRSRRSPTSRRCAARTASSRATGSGCSRRRENVGLRALIRAAGLDGKPLTAGRVGFILAPRLNAVGRLGHALRGVELLMTRGRARGERDRARARGAERAAAGDRPRDARRGARHGRASSILDATYGIVLAEEGWHPGVIGIVASRIVEEFGRPTMLIALDGETGKGSGRSDLRASICTPRSASAAICSCASADTERPPASRSRATASTSSRALQRGRASHADARRSRSRAAHRPRGRARSTSTTSSRRCCATSSRAASAIRRRARRARRASRRAAKLVGQDGLKLRLDDRQRRARGDRLGFASPHRRVRSSRAGRHRVSARARRVPGRARLQAKHRRHRPQSRRLDMRIVAGRWRGRTIDAPAGPRRAPDADRVREAWMSISSRTCRERACSISSPAPARSGSRRCRAAPRCADFVEIDARAFAHLRDNIETLGAGDAATRASRRRDSALSTSLDGRRLRRRVRRSAVRSAARRQRSPSAGSQRAVRVGYSSSSTTRRRQCSPDADDTRRYGTTRDHLLPQPRTSVPNRSRSTPAASTRSRAGMKISCTAAASSSTGWSSPSPSTPRRSRSSPSTSASS